MKMVAVWCPSVKEVLELCNGPLHLAEEYRGSVADVKGPNKANLWAMFYVPESRIEDITAFVKLTGRLESIVIQS